MPTHARHRPLERPRAPFRCGLFILALAAATTSGCAWYSMTPKERVGPPPATAPRTLNSLALDAPREAVLDCARKECNHWYRLDIPGPGVLSVTVETETDAPRPMMRLVVREIGRDPVAQTMGGTASVLEVRPLVDRGLYMVLVQGGGARLPYTVTAKLEPERS